MPGPEKVFTERSKYLGWRARKPGEPELYVRERGYPMKKSPVTPADFAYNDVNMVISRVRSLDLRDEEKAEAALKELEKVLKKYREWAERTERKFDPTEVIKEALRKTNFFRRMIKFRDTILKELEENLSKYPELAKEKSLVEYIKEGFRKAKMPKPKRRSRIEDVATAVLIALAVGVSALARKYGYFRT